MDSPVATSSSETAVRCLSVRFEDACVLIPPACSVPPKSGLVRPRLVTKSYSLPLWKSSYKKSGPQSPVAAPVNDAEAERKAFSLTVSVPSLTIKTRPRRPSLPPASPCLSRRCVGASQSSDASTPPASPISPNGPSPIVASPVLHRAPSFPQIQPAILKQAETIPLRPCCEACYPCVDAALAEGERWSERWSSGAVRRYSEGEHVHLHAPHPAVFGVTRVWTPKGVCEDAEGDMSLSDALKVDEVEVKRRSDDYSHAILNNRLVPPPAKDEDTDDEDTCPETTATAPLVPRYHTAILQEEDEDMLFPLPSPRRSPNQSPDPTPSASQTNLAVASSGSQTNLALSTDSSPSANQEVVPAVVSKPSIMSPSFPTPPAPEPTPTRSPSSSPVRRRERSTSPETRRPQARRSSFSAASESLLKGSASVLRGVAVGITSGVGSSVGVVR